EHRGPPVGPGDCGAVVVNPVVQLVDRLAECVGDETAALLHGLRAGASVGPVLLPRLPVDDLALVVHGMTVDISEEISDWCGVPPIAPCKADAVPGISLIETDRRPPPDA